MTGLLTERLGEGGEGVVWGVPDLGHLLRHSTIHNGRVVGTATSWVFKEYKAHPDVARLAALIDWLALSPVSVRNHLMAATTWPVVLATPRGHRIGVVIPRLGPEFLVKLTVVGQPETRLRVIDYLLWNQEQCTNAGLGFAGLRTRLEVLRDLGDILALLHRSNLVFGDINPQNVVIGGSWEQPRTVLVDCDTARPQNFSGVPVDAPGWEPPERGVSRATDVYKFALLTGFVLGCTFRQSDLVAAVSRRRLGVSSHLHSLLQRGLDGSAQHRPAISELAAALTDEHATTAADAAPTTVTSSRGAASYGTRQGWPNTSTQAAATGSQASPLRPTARPFPVLPAHLPTPTSRATGTTPVRARTTPRVHGRPPPPPTHPQGQQTRTGRVQRNRAITVAAATAVAVIGVVGLSQCNGGTTAAPQPTTTAAPRSGPAAPQVAADSPFTPEPQLAGSFVAVVWSELIGGRSPQEVAATVEYQLGDYGRRLGVPLVALRGDDYLSLRDDTVAVAYDGGFDNARSAAQWCRDRGLNSDNACFGVILSDDHSYDERGDEVRLYPSNLG